MIPCELIEDNGARRHVVGTAVLIGCDADFRGIREDVLEQWLACEGEHIVPLVRGGQCATDGADDAALAHRLATLDPFDDERIEAVLLAQRTVARTSRGGDRDNASAESALHVRAVDEVIDESAKQGTGAELDRALRQIEQRFGRNVYDIATLATDRAEQRTVESWNHSVTPSFQIAISR